VTGCALPTTPGAGALNSMLKRRRESFESGDWPSHVAWWIGDDELPTWEDAFSRQQLIYEEGSTPKAFNFRQPYLPDGTPTKLRKSR